MGQVRYSFRASTDLIDLWLHIVTRSSATADACLDRIETRCERLRTFPKLGPERPDIAADARVLVIERWLVIYRIAGEDVQIVRVVDGSRDLTNLALTED